MLSQFETNFGFLWVNSKLIVGTCSAKVLGASAAERERRARPSGIAFLHSDKRQKPLKIFTIPTRGRNLYKMFDSYYKMIEALGSSLERNFSTCDIIFHPIFYPVTTCSTDTKIYVWQFSQNIDEKLCFIHLWYQDLETSKGSTYLKVFRSQKLSLDSIVCLCILAFFHLFCCFQSK